MSQRALIFDVDGTLADTEEIHRQAFNAAFARHALPWHWGRRIYSDLLKVAGGQERLAWFVELIDIPLRDKAVLKDKIAAIHADKTRFYAQRAAEGEIPLREGIEALIVEARKAGLRLAIASTTTRVNVESLLRHTLGASAIDWFDTIGTGDATVLKKPAPDIYRLVLDRLKLTPDEAIALEDSAIGLSAAKAAGVCTVVTPTTWTEDEDFSAADAVVSTLSDIDLDWLSELHSRWLHDRKAAA
jgi:HAD superfamily hydrolase (TIGR01509 family)